MSSQDFHLSTPGGVPYKIVDLKGSFTEEAANCTGTYLIHAANLLLFVQEGLPGPYTGRARFPGLDTLSCVKIDFEAHDKSRPIDPFGIDSGASDRTYGDLLLVNVEFSTRPENDGSADSSDPRTFLEISCNGSGEFIYTPTRGKAIWEAGFGEPAEQCREIDVPSTVVQPEIEWGCSWSQIPHVYFYNTLFPKIRSTIGKVNSATFPLLAGATGETVLFIGFSMRQQFTWRAGFVGTPPVQADFKFVQKEIEVAGGVTIGHNHFYRPGHGWRKLLVNGSNVYQTADLTNLFVV